MSTILKNYLADNLINMPEGIEVMRYFYDEQKWLSSNSKMSIPGSKGNYHEIKRDEIIKPFLLMQVPVTTSLYHYVLNKEGTLDDNNLPVVNISWYEAVQFCNLLSVAMELKPFYDIDINTEQVACRWENNGFRLPTEAEWQYACHAGSSSYQYGNIDDIAWYQDNSNGTAHKVGEKAPNAWGIYDMLGNVWEWCWDLYDEEHYGSYRTFRGGSWAETQQRCGATCRRRSIPSFKIDDLGFRIAQSR